MEGRHYVTRERLVADLHSLGVEAEDNLFVTASLSSLGDVKGGFQTLAGALLESVGLRGSVFGLSFTRLFRLPLSAKNARYVFNCSTPCVTGGLNQYLLARPDAVRSSHPVTSFVGIGPLARDILPRHTVTSPAYGPVQIAAENDHGKMLLLGTVDSCPGVTTVHVAQDLLGLRPRSMGRWGVNYQAADGSVHLYRKDYAGGCSLGYWKFYDAYRRASAVREGRVGEADCMLATLAKTLPIDMEMIHRDPTVFLCDDPGCPTCRRDWEFAVTSRWKYLPARFRNVTRNRLWGLLRRLQGRKKAR